MNIDTKKIKDKLKSSVHDAMIEKNTVAYEAVMFCYILSFLGGFLDAHTYLSRGKVFVSTQSANLILIAINLSEYKFFQALNTLTPVLAFILGTIWAKWMQKYNKYSLNHSIVFKYLLCEFIIFLLVGIFDDGEYTRISNVILSFITAVQFVTFNKISHFNYASTVAMGNLKSFSESLYLRLNATTNTKRSYHGKKIKIFALLLVNFVIGALLGAILTKILYSKAILFCALLTLANILILKLDFTSIKKS